jgi:hypothetical protein
MMVGASSGLSVELPLSRSVAAGEAFGASLTALPTWVGEIMQCALDRAAAKAVPEAAKPPFSETPEMSQLVVAGLIAGGLVALALMLWVLDVLGASVAVTLGRDVDSTPQSVAQTLISNQLYGLVGGTALLLVLFLLTGFVRLAWGVWGNWIE